jgi:hypothetical protein
MGEAIQQSVDILRTGHTGEWGGGGLKGQCNESLKEYFLMNSLFALY